MEKHLSRTHRGKQQGQAFAEYMALLPAAVMVMIALALVTRVIVDGFGKTVTGLTCPSSFVEQEEPDANNGPTFVDLEGHTIELTAVVYDPSDNTTTVTYTVTSGGRHDISHWSLGLPMWMRSHVTVNAFELGGGGIEWGTDPTTGVTGLKFDREYGANAGFFVAEGGVLAKVPSNTFENFRVQATMDSIATVSREVMLALSGQWDFGDTDVAVKAGPNSFHGTISAPIGLIQDDEDAEQEC